MAGACSYDMQAAREAAAAGQRVLTIVQSYSRAVGVEPDMGRAIGDVEAEGWRLDSILPLPEQPRGGRDQVLLLFRLDQLIDRY
jgi:hypothetical protein